jgi:hypothetical protein
MRLLADRHHADLAESLLLLFEDRFGWEVYFPIGREWRDEGIWLLSQGTPDDEGVRKQFLDLDILRHPSDGNHYTEIWQAHPERVQKLVTLEQFRSMQWDYILASVTPNEHTFARLAREVGAKFILQVGNVYQPVDWSQDPLVMASARIPIEGRGVVYHQEFSLDTFRHEALIRTLGGEGCLTWPIVTVSSFVNLFPRTGCYGLWTQAKAVLSEVRWREYGHEGADGFLAPAAAVADAMRASDVIWHDKPHGDGFGHVVHNAFAVGRPVVGHASHYRGQLAEPLWLDGVTSLDLDGPEAEAKVAALLADPQGRARMGEQAALRFQMTVDFEEDAEAVRRLLE